MINAFERQSIMEIKDILYILYNCDNVNILTHKSPDGDTLGCGFALVNFLRNLGKKANVLNSEPFPKRYEFLYEGYEPMEFEEQFVISVDIADLQLIGSGISKYAKEGVIDLCIDHHVSNTFFAKNTYVDKKAAAACEAIYEIIEASGEKITDIIAKCLYTGIATDTGCFKFENTTPRSHIMASKLMAYDIDYARINRLMFDMKSKGRIAVECEVSKHMEYFFDDRCCVVKVTSQLINDSGIDEAEFEGLTSKTLQLETVEIGVLIKQRDENKFKISVRTTDKVDASVFCQQFGGGGHIRAAGCQIEGSLEEVENKLLTAIKGVLK